MTKKGLIRKCKRCSNKCKQYYPIIAIEACPYYRKNRTNRKNKQNIQNKTHTEITNLTY